MSETLQIHPKTLPEGFCPTTEQDRLNVYAASLVAIGQEATSLFVVQAATPAISDKVWVRLLADGSIDRIYKVVAGAWKSRHPVMVGATLLWTGSQSAIATLDGGTAGTATIDTGPFWEEVTAAIGRTAVHPDPSRILLQNQSVTPSGGGTPVNFLGVLGTGGEESHTLTKNELPQHQHTAGTTAVLNGTGGALTFASGPGVAISTGNMANTTPTDQAHQNMQPYIGMFYIRRTQRIFYRQ